MSGSLSYVSNLLRSVKYAAPEIIRQKLPSPFEIAGQFDTKDKRDELKSIIDDTKEVLKTELGGTLKKAKADALKGLKTGKIFKSQAELDAEEGDDLFGDSDPFAGLDDAFGGDINIDVNVDSTTSSEAVASVATASAKVVAEETSSAIKSMTSKITSDPVGRFTAGKTAEVAELNRVQIGIISSMSRMTMLATNETNTVLKDIFDFHNTTTRETYLKILEDNASIKGLLSDMVEKLKITSEASVASAAATNAVTEMQSLMKSSDHSDIFSNYGAGINVGNYLKVLSRRVKESIGPDGSYSMIMKMMLAAPLNTAVEIIGEELIPASMNKAFAELNNFSTGLGVVLNNKLTGMSNKFQMSGSMGKAFLGRILEFLSVANTIRADNKVDLSIMNREKKALFDGYVYRTIVEVIPSYLADMVSLLTSLVKGNNFEMPTDRKIYDTNSGYFVSAAQKKAEIDRRIEGAAASSFHDVIPKIGTKAVATQKELDDIEALTDEEEKKKRKQELRKKQRMADQDLREGLTGLVLGGFNATDTQTRDGFENELRGTVARLKGIGNHKYGDKLESQIENLMNFRDNNDSRAIMSLVQSVEFGKQAVNKEQYNVVDPTARDSYTSRMALNSNMLDLGTNTLGGSDITTMSKGLDESPITAKIREMDNELAQNRFTSSADRLAHITELNRLKHMRTSGVTELETEISTTDKVGVKYSDHKFSKKVFENDAGQVTVGSVLMSPLKIVTTGMLKLQKKTADLLFGVKDQDEKNLSFLDKLKLRLFGESTPGGSGSTILGDLVSGIKENVIAPLTDKIFGSKGFDPNDPDVRSGGMVNNFKEKFASVLGNVNSYLFGKGEFLTDDFGNQVQTKNKGIIIQAFDSLKTNLLSPIKKQYDNLVDKLFGSKDSTGQRSGGLLAQAYTRVADFSKKSFDYVKDKLESTFNFIKDKFTMFTDKMSNLFNKMISKINEKIVQPLKEKVKEYSTIAMNFVKNSVVTPMMDKILGKRDASGNRSGGIFSNFINTVTDKTKRLFDSITKNMIPTLKNKLFSKGETKVDSLGRKRRVNVGVITKIMENINSKLFTPIKEGILGKNGKGGILGSIKKSITDPLVDNLLGKKNKRTGVRSGGILKDIKNSFSEAFKPLKETFFGKDGIFTNIKNGLKKFGSDVMDGIFGKNRKKITIEQMVDKATKWMSKKFEVFGKWMNEKIFNFSKLIKTSQEWMIKKVIQPFGNWLNNPESGIIPKIGRKVTEFLDKTKDFLFGKDGVFTKFNQSVKTFFFGDKEKGTQGLYDRVFVPIKDMFKDKIYEPMKKSISDMYDRSVNFFKEEVINPLKGVFQPFIEEFKIQMGNLKDWVKGPLWDAIKGAGTTIDGSIKGVFGKSLTETLEEKVLKPIRDTLNKVKEFLIKSLASVFKFPVNLLKNASDDLKMSQLRRGYGHYLSDEEKERLGKKYNVNVKELQKDIVSSDKVGTDGEPEKKSLRDRIKDTFSRNKKTDQETPNESSTENTENNKSKVKTNAENSTRDVRNEEPKTNSNSESTPPTATPSKPTSETKKESSVVGKTEQAAQDAIVNTAEKDIVHVISAKKKSAHMKLVDTALMSIKISSFETGKNTKRLYDFVRRNLRNVGYNVERLVKKFKANKIRTGGNTYTEEDSFFGKIFNFIRNPIKGITELGGKLLGLFGRAIAAPFNFVMKHLGNIVNGITNAVKGAGEVVLKGIKILGEGVDIFVRNIGNLANGLASAISSMTSAIGKMAVTLVETTGKIITTALDFAPKILKGLGEFVSEFGKFTGKFLVGAGNLLNGLLKFSGKVLGGVVSIGTSVAKGLLKGGIGSLFSNFSNKIMPVYVVGGRLAGTKGGADTMEEASKLTKSGLKNLASKMKEAAKEKAEKAKTAIKDSFNDLKEKWNKFRGKDSNTTHDELTEDRKEKKESKIKKLMKEKFEDHLVKIRGHLSDFKKSFSNVGTMLLAIVPAIGTAIGNVASLLSPARFIPTLIAAWSRMKGMELPSLKNLKNLKNLGKGKVAKKAIEIGGKLAKGLKNLSTLKKLSLAGAATAVGLAALGVDGDSRLGRTASYAATGATIGSFFGPGIGTAIGAATGALVANLDLLGTAARSAAVMMKDQLFGTDAVIDEKGNIVKPGTKSIFTRFAASFFGGTERLVDSNGVIVEEGSLSVVQFSKQCVADVFQTLGHLFWGDSEDDGFMSKDSLLVKSWDFLTKKFDDVAFSFDEYLINPLKSFAESVSAFMKLPFSEKVKVIASSIATGVSDTIDSAKEITANTIDSAKETAANATKSVRDFFSGNFLMKIGNSVEKSVDENRKVREISEDEKSALLKNANVVKGGVPAAPVTAKADPFKDLPEEAARPAYLSEKTTPVIEQSKKALPAIHNEVSPIVAPVSVAAVSSDVKAKEEAVKIAAVSSDVKAKEEAVKIAAVKTPEETHLSALVKIVRNTFLSAKYLEALTAVFLPTQIKNINKDLNNSVKKEVEGSNTESKGALTSSLDKLEHKPKENTDDTSILSSVGSVVSNAAKAYVKGVVGVKHEAIDLTSRGMETAANFFKNMKEKFTESSLGGSLISTFQDMKEKASGFISNFKGSGPHENILKKTLLEAGITDPTEIAQFLAQTSQETGDFKWLKELGGPEYFKKYEGHKGLGNTQPGDGYKFKGRGYIQITGRANYKKYGEMLGVDLISKPELAERPDIAAKIALAYWQTRTKPKVKNFNDTKAVTYTINGGYNGLSGRMERFKKYMALGDQLTKVDSTDPSNSFLGNVAATIGDKASAFAGATVKAGSEMISKLASFVTRHDDGVNIEGLRPEVKANFAAAAEEYYKKTGKKPLVTSAYRSLEKQAELYRTLGPNQAGRPGGSLHNFGYAIDVNSPDATLMDKMGILDKYGFHRPLLNAKPPKKKEPWHIQPKGITIAAARQGLNSSDAETNQPVPVDKSKQSQLTNKANELIKKDSPVAKGQEEQPKLKTAMFGGMLDKLPTLVGEREPEVLDPSGKIYQSLDSFMQSNSSTEKVMELVKGTAVKEALKRNSQMDSKGSDVMERLLEKMPNGSSEEIMKEMIIVLKEISSNTKKSAEKEFPVQQQTNPNERQLITKEGMGSSGGNNLFLGQRQASQNPRMSDSVRRVVSGGL